MGQLKGGIYFNYTYLEEVFGFDDIEKCGFSPDKHRHRPSGNWRGAGERGMKMMVI
jgi:hypothetical protein